MCRRARENCVTPAHIALAGTAIWLQI